MIWSERQVPQNLFRTESCRVKVGFVVQKLHGPEISKMQNFGQGARFRAVSYIFPALLGAARYALASSYGRMWLVETIPLLCRESYKQYFSPQCVEAGFWSKRTNVSIVIRFGS